MALSILKYFSMQAINRVIDALNVELASIAKKVPRAGDAPVNAVASTVSTSMTGANNDLTITAKVKGTAGDDITIELADPGAASSAIGVAVNGGTNIVVSLATNAGTPQVETATVTAAAGATGNGEVNVTVTSALLASPVVVPVTLASATHTTAALIAAAMRTAVNANAFVSEHFTAGGTGADLVVTAKVAAANDETFNVAIEGALGVSAVASSANTTAGVAYAITSTAAQVKAAIEANATANALVTVANKASDTGAGVVTALEATPLANGVDGTVGTAWEVRYASNYVYLCASASGNTIADANWVKAQFVAA